MKKKEKKVQIPSTCSVHSLLLVFCTHSTSSCKCSRFGCFVRLFVHYAECTQHVRNAYEDQATIRAVNEKYSFKKHKAPKQ